MNDVDAKLSELLQGAFETVPAREANEAIARVRREQGADGDARSYELVFTSWDAFAAEQLPKLVYHLESIGAHPPACAGVVIAAFAGDELRFLHARDLVASAGRLLGLTAAQLVERHGTGESRTALRGDAQPALPLALPPPEEP